MERIRTLDALHAWRRAHRRAGDTIGFVPTMGYLHEGHLTLCRTARPESSVLAASIFVNPLQFGPTEDLSRYPRDEAGDLARLESVGVDMVFLPAPALMYPPGFSTEVQVLGLQDGLCGRSRPGHFKGVATVVAKLFHLVRPDRAYFGLKDYQQFRILCKMVNDLGMDIVMIGVPTVREPDGLAMSSRNAYLTPPERLAARVLSRALLRARDAHQTGDRDAEALRTRALEVLMQEPLARLDYLEVVDAETLGPPDPARAMVIATAVRIGQTRLIDNLVLEPG